MKKNQYDSLKEQIEEVSASIAKDTGYTRETAESLIKLMTAVASQQADIVTQQHNRAQRDAKILATRELLKNYHKIRASVQSAIISTDQIVDENDIKRLMEKEESMKNQQIRALAIQTARSKALLAQINSALDSFKEICTKDSDPVYRRYYSLLYLYYIYQLTVDQICERLSISRMTFFRGVEEAIKEFSIIIPLEATVKDFGDSQKRGRKGKSNGSSSLPTTDLQ